MQLMKHCTHRAQALFDWRPLELMMICMIRTIVSNRAPKVKEPMWYRLILPVAVQKKPPSIAQYHIAHAVEMRKLKTQQKNMPMKIQTKMKNPSIPISPLLLTPWFLCILARICTATTLTAQKTKNRHDRKNTHTPAIYTSGRSPMNLPAISINFMPSQNSFLMQMRKRMKKTIDTDMATMSPKLLLQMPITRMANRMQNIATTIVQTTHRRQQRTRIRYSTAITIDRASITLISPGYFEKTSPITLLESTPPELFIISRRDDDWSAITNNPSTKKVSITSTKKTQQQGSLRERSSAGPRLMVSTSSRNLTLSCQQTGSILYKVDRAQWKRQHHFVSIARSRLIFWQMPAIRFSSSALRYMYFCIWGFKAPYPTDLLRCLALDLPRGEGGDYFREERTGQDPFRFGVAVTSWTLGFGVVLFGDKYLFYCGEGLFSSLGKMTENLLFFLCCLLADQACSSASASRALLAYPFLITVCLFATCFSFSSLILETTPFSLMFGNFGRLFSPGERLLDYGDAMVFLGGSSVSGVYLGLSWTVFLGVRLSMKCQ